MSIQINARLRGLLSLLFLFSTGSHGGVIKPTATSCKSETLPKNGTLKPVTFGSTLATIRWPRWAKDNDEHIFAITSGTGFAVGGDVFRSSDNGSNWVNLTTHLPGFTDFDNHTYGILRGAIEFHHRVNGSEKILVQGAGHYNWISVDFGNNWERVDSPASTIGYWTQIKLHPSQEDWMLAVVRRHACQWQATSFDKWCASDLFVTKDFGRSWTNLTANSDGRIASFVDFDWGARLHRWSRSAGARSDETIFATAYEDPKHMKGPLPSWDKNVHYVMSHDLFKTPHEKLVSCGNQFDIISNQVFLAVPSNCPYHPNGSKRKLSAAETVSSSVIMYVSGDEGSTFHEACIPAGDLDLGYQMRPNFYGDGAMLMIDHGAQDVATSRAPVSNIYTSGGNTSLFSLSLARAFRKDGHVDFSAVEGLPGLFIANTLGLSALEDAAFRWDSDVDFERYVQTRVSYNGGAHWNLLKRPETFNYPRCDTCSKLNSSWECQLHLHGPSSWRSTEGKVPQLHSHFSAPGLVMAVGNVGQYLDYAADSTCTFLSRDGGETWEDVADYANVFEFGDQGGLLVMARHQTQGPADHVHVSIDEGQCWQRVNLSEAINIHAIRVEPTLRSQVFLVHGQACEQSEQHPTCTHTEQGTAPAGKLYYLDFESILGDEWKMCDKESDYERWSVPSDERCLLGRNISLSRRKRDSACFNGKGWERPQGFNETCDCSWIDVECEFGFEWNWGERRCTEMGGVDLQTCPQIREKRYTISETHLRLLNGDACHNISRVINDTDGRGHSTLPHRPGLPKWAIVVIALLVAVVLVSIVAMYLKKQTDPEAGGAALLAAPLAAVGDGVAWLKAKITGSRRSDDDYFQLLPGGGNEEFGVDDEQDLASPTRHP